jgi:hypothetical protein
MNTLRAGARPKVVAVAIAILMCFVFNPDAGRPLADTSIAIAADQSSGGCALPNYPDASCTGVPVGTPLTVVNGSMTIGTANAIVENKDVRGCITVTAPGVTIRNVRVSGRCIFGIRYENTSGSRLIIQDTEISCEGEFTGIYSANFTAIRVNIHDCENGLSIGRNVTLQDSYIHDLVNIGDNHADGIQMTDGSTGVIIQHNRIYATNGTSAIISPSQSTLGTIIRDNLFAGGAYALYCRQRGPGGQQIVNNHFSTLFYPKVGAFGPWTECGDEAQVSGNVYHETGLLLSGQSGPAPPRAPTNVRIIGWLSLFEARPFS